MSEKPTILIVDDTPANLQLLADLLKEEYRVKVANNGIKALSLAEASPPDLVLLDVMMPEMDGFEVCRRLKNSFVTCDVPVLLLSAKNSPEDEEMGFSVGAVDFIHKPISPPVVNARIKTHLKIKQWGDMLNKNKWLEAEIQRRLNEVHKMQEASMMVMVSLAEFRDECTGLHIVRTQKYVEMLAEELSKQHKYRDVLTPEVIKLWGRSAQLHDIGKIAIPDAILLKPGKLTDEEFEIMKTHTTRGYDILKQADCLLECDENAKYSFLTCSMEIALYHHEKWNGRGYPSGLAGEDIPLSARLMAVADVYDALRSARPYKAAMPHQKALDILMKDAGSHFDPSVIDAFLRIEKKCEEISIEMMDEVTNEDEQINKTKNKN